MKKTDKTKNALEYAADGAEWVDCLLDLFWEVDAQHKEDHSQLSPRIMRSYMKAESARGRLIKEDA